jgi:hypothetical protein
LRALADGAPSRLTDIERLAAYRAFESRRTVASGARSGASWLTITWRAAAGIALILTSAAVWRAVGGGAPASEWNPGPALEGFVEDLADLDVRGREVGALLGAGLLDDPAPGAWEGPENGEGGELAVPWEVDP